MKKIFCVMAMILFTLVLSGCGEEEKYNAAKNDFVKIEQEWHKIPAKTENIEQHVEMAKQLDAKITEMEPLAKTKMEMNNDLMDLKKKYKEDGAAWERGLKEVQAIEKMHKDLGSNAYGPAIDDPWTTYGKAKK